MGHIAQIIALDSIHKRLYLAIDDNLYNVDVSSGEIKSFWKNDLIKEKNKSIIENSSSEQQCNDISEPPSKKVKFNIESNTKELKNLNLLSNNSRILLIKLVPSLNILVAATEAKNILVFNISDDKIILEIVYNVPKRPSALDVYINNENKELNSIIVGDKFGDVLSFSLNKDDNQVSVAEIEKSEENDEEDEKNNSQTETNDIESKRPKNIIMGHVSMLLDLIIAFDKNKKKSFLITADRDEHIRISLYPQAYIIENYLLFHTQYVSSLYIPTWDQSLLVSGGGDDFIILWNWTTGEKLQQCNILRPLVDGNFLSKGHHLDKNGKFIATISSIRGIAATKQIFISIEACNVLLVLQQQENSIQLKFIGSLNMGSEILSLATPTDLSSNKIYISTFNSPYVYSLNCEVDKIPTRDLDWKYKEIQDKIDSYDMNVNPEDFHHILHLRKDKLHV